MCYGCICVCAYALWYGSLSITRYGHICTRIHACFSGRLGPEVIREEMAPKGCLWPPAVAPVLVVQPGATGSCPLLCFSLLMFSTFTLPWPRACYILLEYLVNFIIFFHASMTSTVGPFCNLAPTGLNFTKTLDD